MDRPQCEKWSSGRYRQSSLGGMLNAAAERELVRLMLEAYKRGWADALTPQQREEPVSSDADIISNCPRCGWFSTTEDLDQCPKCELGGTT